MHLVAYHKRISPGIISNTFCQAGRSRLPPTIAERHSGNWRNTRGAGDRDWRVAVGFVFQLAYPSQGGREDRLENDGCRRLQPGGTGPSWHAYSAPLRASLARKLELEPPWCRMGHRLQLPHTWLLGPSCDEGYCFWRRMAPGSVGAEAKPYIVGAYPCGRPGLACGTLRGASVPPYSYPIYTALSQTDP